MANVSASSTIEGSHSKVLWGRGSHRLSAVTDRIRLLAPSILVGQLVRNLKHLSGRPKQASLEQVMNIILSRTVL
jgi:hypothetical protein